jgi:hypothetical protein
MLENKFYSVGKQTTDVWLTPPDLIEKLGEFDLDPCCPNNLPWKTATSFYSLENGQNGLELPWGGRVWCNPPYSNWGAFLEKLKNHNNGISLIFARTETKAFFDHVWNNADSILFLKRRVKFIRADFSSTGSSTAPSVLIAYGKNNTEALEKSGLEGKLIFLK